MLDRLRPRLTYSNVMLTLLTFVVLGGGAYAAHTHKIGAKDLRNGAVTGPKIRGQAVAAGKLRNDAVRSAKIQDGAVGTAALADGSVTGDKVDESTLGKVPSAEQADDAAALGGIGPSGFVQGSGSTFAHVADDDVTGAHAVVVPGVGELINICAVGAFSGPSFESTVVEPLVAWGSSVTDSGGDTETSIAYESLVNTEELTLSIPSGAATSHFQFFLRPQDTSSSLATTTIDIVLEETASGCEWMTTVTRRG